MQKKIVLTFDTTTKILNITTDLQPFDLATVLSQATTQALMRESEQRLLLLNPLPQRNPFVSER
jgi:hypothetical protein